MRPHSQNSQISISDDRRTGRARARRPAIATMILMIAMMNAPAVWSDTETIEGHGRRSQTGPKGVQVELDGFPIVDVSQSPAETGYSTERAGRHLRAKPSQPVSVGLVGCPGCTAILGALGGVFIEIDGRRELRPTQRWRNENNHGPASPIHD